jgi:hypothetical protein
VGDPLLLKELSESPFIGDNIKKFAGREWRYRRYSLYLIPVIDQELYRGDLNRKNYIYLEFPRGAFYPRETLSIKAIGGVGFKAREMP